MTIAEILQDKYTVCHPPYMGDAPEYVTYQMQGQSTLYADDREIVVGMNYAVDLYTQKTPLAAAVKDIKKRLIDAGWTCEVSMETYEEDTGFYHISMAASTAEEVYG